MSKSGNYRILTILAYLCGRTCCRRAKICMRARRTESAPGSASLIPCTCFNCVVVSAASRNNKVPCLVPFIVPVVSGSVGVHSTKDYVRVFLVCRNCNLIYSKAGVIGHAYPCFTVSKEVSSETSVRLLPVRIGCKIKFFGLTGGSACCNHRHARQEYYNCKKSY